MSEALNIIKSIYLKFITFIFNDAVIAPNVSIGWILLGCIIFGVLIRNILSLPSKGQSITRYKEYDSNMDRDHYWS